MRRLIDVLKYKHVLLGTTEKNGRVVKKFGKRHRFDRRMRQLAQRRYAAVLAQNVPEETAPPPENVGN